MNSLAARRRHPAALVVLLIIGLFATGGIYTLLTPTAGAGTRAMTQADISEGQRMFLANCATCHGAQGQGTPDGPSMVGVGAAAVDFQMGTGRMPLAAPTVQAMRTFPVKFNQQQIDQIAAYVQTLGPGPEIPDEQYASGVGGDTARGAQIFLVNCAMCHNFAGSGGALTRGKLAPKLHNIEGKHIYEAMLTGPQSMPVFNDTNLSPEAKADVIAYLHELDKQESPGGLGLGNIGPVGDAFFFWLIGIPLMIGAAVWLGRKAA
ncbi:ubiquinol-cytochrome c reductase cytochrome c subunit [Kineosphaera limosa]|uniref:Cytochrome bc1 complex cytochrome c subunit n=1 Tax=Kineosphaera limosa NBRC 100340 TaxID=1184609 RepID=K6WCD2_9MICO|nr:c-type cytochrome [Kineosphaera limosa]NYD99040.1 ubiquinol-cytochrome c reductase cytochrome c subunit [Kineosphaera limosa]GAB96925.1 menaquinol-cytochrome c reductase cytochrome c subunit [Kineosphaera limosa NBRC 100340]